MRCAVNKKNNFIFPRYLIMSFLGLLKVYFSTNDATDEVYDPATFSEADFSNRCPNSALLIADYLVEDALSTHSKPCRLIREIAAHAVSK